jgi:hypothetical protein
MTRNQRETVRLALLALGLFWIGACNRGPTPQQVRTEQEQAARAVANSPCPPDGKWKDCNLADRLMNAGLVLRRDSTPAREDSVPIAGVLYHIGIANLKVFFFADSMARKAAVARLDTTQFVGYDQSQTSKGERSLIQSANVLALLDSRRDQQRERIGDAITAGPPQPPKGAN